MTKDTIQRPIAVWRAKDDFTLTHHEPWSEGMVRALHLKKGDHFFVIGKSSAQQKVIRFGDKQVRSAFDENQLPVELYLPASPEQANLPVKVPLKIRLFAGDVLVAESSDIDLWCQVLKNSIQMSEQESAVTYEQAEREVPDVLRTLTEEELAKVEAPSREEIREAFRKGAEELRKLQKNMPLRRPGSRYLVGVSKTSENFEEVSEGKSQDFGEKTRQPGCIEEDPGESRD